MLLLVRLKFRSGLKIGEGDLPTGGGILHSDTLFGAILNQWAKLYESDSIVDLILNLNVNSPPFRISSAFPYILGEYYLPTPYGNSELYMEKLKNLPFLELFDFLELAKGNDDWIKKKKLRNPMEDLISNFVAPRVTIDRISANTNIYQTPGWLMNKNGGLYFLIDLKDESFLRKLKVSVRMLGESGLGGDRSVGYGLFEPEFENIDGIEGWSEVFQKREGENIVYCTLSLCCPLTGEEAEAISYRILPRKGWIFSSSSIKQMKRRECKMFAEGSLFTSPIQGEIIDVTPSGYYSEHNVYRYGLGMMVEIVNKC
jgi:CRISPR-associated protein Csm4